MAKRIRPDQAVAEYPRIDSQAAIDLVMELLALPGRSRQEDQVMKYLVGRLKGSGVPASCISFDTAHKKSTGTTGNLIVKLPGTVKGPRRLMMAHVDTVPICAGCVPVRKGNVISAKNHATGLGGDDRAGVAVVLNSWLEIVRQNLPHPPLTLLFTVQEEIGLCGARYVSAAKLGKPQLCYNWDGDNPAEICIGATGDYGITIDIEGIASHAGVHPEKGVNAITIASIAIASLHRDGWLGLIKKSGKAGSSNIGVIQGGEATNVVTPKVSLRAEARSHDPEFRKQIVAAMESAFHQAVDRVATQTGQKGVVTFRSELKYESFRMDENAPVVQSVQAAIRTIGLAPFFDIGNGGLDANWMSAHGFPTVTLGCGQHQIHTVDEYLQLDEFLNGCQLGLLLCTDPPAARSRESAKGR